MAVVATAQEPPLLVPAQRVVGRAQVTHDLLGRPAVRVAEQVDDKLLDRRRVRPNAAVAVDCGHVVLQPIVVLLLISGAQRPCSASNR